jgi:hypothetical protein
MASTGFTKKDFYAALESMYGDLDVLMTLDKEAGSFGGKSVKWAIDQLVKQKIVDPKRALTILNKTGWFKKHAETTTRRLIAEKERPELVQEEIAQKRSSLQALFQEYGIQMSGDALNSLARNAYMYEWSEEFVMDEVQKTKSGVTYSGGAIQGAVDDMTAFADDYGVRLTEADINQLRNDVIDIGPQYGTAGLQELIQQRSAQTYSIWADEILAGRSVKALAGAYFTKAAELLEVEPNSIAWDDPLFAGGKAFTAVDQKTGKQIQKGLWDFEKEIRQDSRWMETQNARDSMIKTTAGLLNTMGLV